MATSDLDLPVGTQRECLGLTWTLYRNQYGTVWKAGPLAHNVKVAAPSSVANYHLEDKILRYATFEKAAAAAIDVRGRDYREAKELVTAYEAARHAEAGGFND